MKFVSALSAGLLASALTLGGVAVAETPKQPSGTVSIEETQFGLIIGGSVGGGKLMFEGQEHKFQLGGLSLGANIGISKMAAVGKVYDLKRLEDFPGTYVRLEGNIALGGGVGSMNLKNENGVIMNLEGTTLGLQFNIGASGVTISFDKK